MAIYLACLRTGAIFVPLNTAYTKAEVDFFTADAEPALIIDGSTLTDFTEAADQAEPWLRCEARLADDIAAIVYTSGTTGRSKGAMLTHANLTSNALTLHAIWRFSPGDVLLHVLPIFHVHGLFVALHTAILNASTVLFESRFDVERALALMSEATVMMGVPTHYIRLLADDRLTPERCNNMRLFTSGSAPMTAGLHAEFTERTGHQILERYGMSEAGMITSNPYDGERIPGTVGFQLPAVSLRIVRDGSECGPGEVGVVQVRGPNVFAGYWRLPERTAEEYDGDWFITGDVGHLDIEGRLTLEGRSSDMIISGGLNIYPKEIELILDAVEGVAETAVVGVPDDDLGEQVVAFVVAAEGKSVDLEAILDHARNELAGFKIPKQLELIDALPRNSMGKVQKSLLRGPKFHEPIGP